MSSEEIKIIAEPQVIPENCKFTIDRVLFDGPSIRFSSAEDAKGSPLAEALFAIGNIAGLLVTQNSVTVSQKTPEDWRVMGKNVGTAIRSSIISGNKLISDEVINRAIPNQEIEQKIREVLEKEINPAVASHGGYIELLEVKNNDVFVKMGGGCQGCGSATATLKHGVEMSLRKAIPSIGAIYDTTDHASGKNPYFQK